MSWGTLKPNANKHRSHQNSFSSFGSNPLKPKLGGQDLIAFLLYLQPRTIPGTDVAAPCLCHHRSCAQMSPFVLATVFPTVLVVLTVFPPVKQV